MRYAIWAAVSTETQARKDKISLSDQESKCRELARGKGWQETAGPFVVPGESRTKWINLSDAARAIQALAELLASARRHEFDVLILWDFTRLRDLLKPLSTALADQRIQLYSLAQPIEPIEPRHYDSSLTDTAEILEDATGMASRLEGKHRQRRWRTGMLARVRSGLHSGPAPFGYRKPRIQEVGKKLPLELDPEKAHLVEAMKDMFLAGRSLSQIAAFANQSTIPAPRGGPWTLSTVRVILTNPFYAGTVIFGRLPSQRDRMTGRTLRVHADPERVLQIPGQHPPLWDESSYRRILAELRRRGHAFGGRMSWQLSQLLHCEICGALLWASEGGDYSKQHTPEERLHYWRCSQAVLQRQHGHVTIRSDEALRRVGLELVKALKHLDRIPSPKREDPQPGLLAELADLRRRRQRWLDAFEAGSLDARAFGERTAELTDRIQALHERLEAFGSEQARLDHAHAARADLAKVAEGLPAWLMRAEKQEVNARLRDVLESITIGKDHSVALIWR